MAPAIRIIAALGEGCFGVVFEAQIDGADSSTMNKKLLKTNVVPTIPSPWYHRFVVGSVASKVS
ncbi:hypothetical protein BFW01_g10341 [Lasiodiplodia theobromae]|uniref:Protein kinase domain-containing protein n=1 Tax=Lasiodiplodia theobromae TaxID=45133 RepID=A0A8H7M9X9_9PEZI|nr:hypothetical protein BFW01_g10341 [Lasiodiplodia theobromae]